jgi:predicted RNase H-like HicB family nuclease
MLLRKTIHALIYPGEEGGFVAECVEMGNVHLEIEMTDDQTEAAS